MVVLRSTTPCVAVSSRSNSTLLTVISIVPTAVSTAIAASTGIDFFSPAAEYFSYFPYLKYNTYKTSSNSRRVGKGENFNNCPIGSPLGSVPSCEKSVPYLAEPLQQDSHFSHSPQPLHSFHIS